MEKSKIGNYRWVICALLFFATTINYIDRQILGLLKPTLEVEFNWTETDYANIVMVFAGCYALGYIIFGNFIDRIGSKLGYSISIIIWSIAAIAHAFVKSTFGFGAVRALLGLGEAGNFPAAVKATAEWFPKRERALATGIFNSGTSIGAVAAPIMVPWLLGAYGWQEAFLITGALGFVWLIFWWLFYEIPSRHKKIKTPEFEYIHSDSEDIATPDQKPIKWAKLVQLPQTWVFISGKLLTDPIWWFFLFWLPSYFATTFALDLKKPSLHLAVVYTATTFGSIGGGYLSSYLIKKMGWAPLRARKTTLLVVAIAVLPIILAQFATDIWVAVGIISIAAAAHQAWSANIFTIVSDIFPKRAVSSVVGIGGMAGSIGSTLFPLLVGSLLDYYKAAGNIGAGYNILFIICGLAYLVAWLIIHFLTKNMKPVEEALRD
ncbi:MULTISPECIES: MFS transporter [Dyadobacter]|uniref:MFS transporter n=1 Tax=Dyadobacter chenhuakuii TaxID=2909339 RepID=A0A9X1QBS5_9BACT|nr:MULTISPECIES: MFS transporter [Dyadobacter]MCE7072394.1 MFS transporter [Dyadobacter sp. CY327]MCF2494557.1 MFS transporter [Dyadobacter chenhuakuii]MCF2497537.1 MFS transporter [Dyadobacter chenhuakuii]MCF2519714.1 MFS transporter [Dyadobacter sp. CY351]USJ32120.1 MFS transporter [Dyadobacter chenhuakuii]